MVFYQSVLRSSQTGLSPHTGVPEIGGHPIRLLRETMDGSGLFLIPKTVKQMRGI